MATDNPKDTSTTAFEQQAVVIAEQLGRIAGTIEGTAEQWLNRQSIAEQLTRVRDSASQLLESLAGGAVKGRQAATEQVGSVGGQLRTAATTAVTAASSAVSSLGSSMRNAGRTRSKGSKKRTPSRAKPVKARMDLAHAPGKKHRGPAPNVKGAKKSDERIAKLKTAATARQRRKSYA